MNKSTNFQGFSEPEENYYKLPNIWFDYWFLAREESSVIHLLLEDLAKRSNKQHGNRKKNEVTEDLDNEA